MDYITKAECEKRGFVRGEDGLYRKLNTLERYGRDGWLNFGDPKYGAVDRVSAGIRLWRDFYHGKIASTGVNDLTKVRVDSCGSGDLTARVLDARDRFNKAIAAIPKEFAPVVIRVCCDDLEFSANGSARKKIYAKHRQAVLLCCGLDRLIDHYRRYKWKAQERTG